MSPNTNPDELEIGDDSNNVKSQLIFRNPKFDLVGAG